MAFHNDLGKTGEDIAVEFLKDKGLEIITRNYNKPYGEIDIVARETSGLIRFVEVKTVSYGTVLRPEENMHPQKVRRLMRVIQAYIISKSVDEWVFDLLCVYIDQKDKSAKVDWIKDIILE